MRVVHIAIAAALWTASAHSMQTPLYEFEGTSYGSSFGSAVCAAGDVDGDGMTDVLVGAPFHDIAVGAARIYSGKDGRLLHDLSVPAEGSVRFGAAVARAGDLNGDGHADVLVGAPASDEGERVNSGSAWVFSGADGSVLAAFHGEHANDGFGRAVASAGDVDGDGTADLIVGAPRGGYARVFSGRDGSLLMQLGGAAERDGYGTAVAGAGDVDGDGHHDLLVGADQAALRGTGYVQLVSGSTGEVLYSWQGDRPDANFGGSVSAAGDVNADGVLDIAVGTGTHDHHRSAAGFGPVQVFSGRDGSPLLTFDSPGAFVAELGDVDDDGHDDVLIGRPGALGHGGIVAVLSGRTGEVITSYAGQAEGERFGTAIDGAGDVNGDGRPDIIVGADEFLSVVPAHGVVRVMSIDPPLTGQGGARDAATDEAHG